MPSRFSPLCMLPSFWDTRTCKIVRQKMTERPLYVSTSAGYRHFTGSRAIACDCLDRARPCLPMFPAACSSLLRPHSELHITAHHTPLLNSFRVHQVQRAEASRCSGCFSEVLLWAVGKIGEAATRVPARELSPHLGRGSHSPAHVPKPFSPTLTFKAARVDTFAARCGALCDACLQSELLGWTLAECLTIAALVRCLPIGIGQGSRSRGLRTAPRS